MTAQSISLSALSGAYLLLNFIDSESSNHLTTFIDSCSWSKSLSRRTQHYGYSYDYTSGAVSSQKIGELPSEFNFITEKLNGIFNEFVPNQVIVNEYEPGQGISAHIDSRKFGSHIASLSLLSDIVMTFRNKKTEEIVDVELPINSLIILTGESRYDWTHEIAKRKKDNGKFRGRRVSVTFRTV